MKGSVSFMIHSIMLKLGLTLLLSLTGGYSNDEQPQQNQSQSSSLTQNDNDNQLQSQLDELMSKMVLTSPTQVDTVQVFDVKEGHVIKSVPNSGKIQKQTKQIIKKIYEFAPQVQPDMSAKYIIRIPVKAGTQVKVGGNTIAINELFIFYYEDKEPLVLIFDSNKRPYLLNTKQSIEPLLKLIQVN